MHVVVTGATGNVGTAVLRRLAQEGHRLTGVVRRPPSGHAGGGPGTSWVSTDLSRATSRAALLEAFRGADAVVHLAWQFQPSHREQHLAQVGVGGTRRVAEAAAEVGVPHLVHLSSVGAYATAAGDQRVDEAWPTTGVPSSPYSRHKAAAEALLDELEATGAAPAAVTRLRPGIVGQRGAGSALLRYGLPALVPAATLKHLPVLPLDPSLRLPVVHADDVADAVARVLDQRADGAFNLADEPPLTAHDVATVLGARLLPLPAPVLRAAVSASWHARAQPLDPGWVDLAFATPLMDTGRARRELGWAPTRGALAVLRETVDGMASADAGATPALRPRHVVGALRDAALRGSVAVRERP